MNSSVLRAPLIQGLTRLQRRTWREFAEKEITLPPGGPREGLRFSVGFRPWVGEVLDVFGGSRYSSFFGSGPTQDGKTFLFCTIPALYHAFEMRQNVILGAPVAEISRALYLERILPVIESTRYREMLPRAGVGSRGGRTVSYIQFRHGPWIRFVGAGGRDSQRSGWTAPVVIATELDKMDEAGRRSKETDPVSQLRARTGSFAKLGTARFYGECSMSTEDGTINREVCEIGTHTRIYLPCVKCGEWVWPERKDFAGWSGAPNVDEARRKAAYVCPGCRHPWTEEDRQAALQRPRLVARGQTIGKDGAVQGEVPPTNTFGLRWNSMASPFKSQADLGEAEWRAELTEREADKKAVVQFWWAEPWRPEGLSLSVLSRQIVERKISGFLKGAVPPGVVKITVSADLGARVCHWVAIGWTADARGYIIDYGQLRVPETGDAEPIRILTALRVFRDEVLTAGWASEGGARGADLVLVDSGYHPDATYPFVLESGQGAFAATKGFGGFYRAGGWSGAARNADPGMAGDNWTVSPQPDGVMLVNLHADYWKGAVHDGFAAALGYPGSLSLYRAERAEHAPFARQIVGEKRIPEDDPKKSLRFRWHRTTANHYLDCCAMARAGADMLGIKAVPVEGEKASTPAATGQASEPRQKGGGGWLRAKY